MSRPFSLPATLVAGALALSACAPASPAAGPTPVTGPVVEAVDPGGESASIVQVPVRPAPRDILGPYTYDLPVEANSWVEGELDFLVGERREMLGRWLQRGDFYEPFVRDVLRSYRVPTDLFYLGMIESAFLPTARSGAGAVGFWQFMPSTGRSMSLRVDSLVDERMDPVRSTRAAARHLRELRDEMGDWALAIASYNAGTGRISRALKAYSVDNFWDLAQNGDLAEETRHYVPRLYAMAAIAKGRDHFGFAPAAREHFAYDSVQVEYATPLAELAEIGDVSLGQLTSLNPHLLRRVTPAGGYWVWVPVGKGMAMQRAWLASDFRRAAADYGVQKPAGRKPVAAAKSTPTARSTATARTAVPAKVASAGEKAEAGSAHVVRKGDTLWSIARRYGVTVDSIQSANNLTDRPIQPGMRLTIPVS